jgi:hypothetical protein
MAFQLSVYGCNLALSPITLAPERPARSSCIRIKASVFAHFPVGFELGRRDVPLRTAFSQHSTQVLPKLFEGRSAKKPIALVDLEYHETMFEDDNMRDHWIVTGVRVPMSRSF